VEAAEEDIQLFQAQMEMLQMALLTQAAEAEVAVMALDMD
jgi:hypothetical protein